MTDYTVLQLRDFARRVFIDHTKNKVSIEVTTISPSVSRLIQALYDV
jgi:hypothetical protein